MSTELFGLLVVPSIVIAMIGTGILAYVRWVKEDKFSWVTVVGIMLIAQLPLFCFIAVLMN